MLEKLVAQSLALCKQYKSFNLIVVEISLFDFLLNVHGKQPGSCQDHPSR